METIHGQNNHGRAGWVSRIQVLRIQSMLRFMAAVAVVICLTVVPAAQAESLDVRINRLDAFGVQDVLGSVTAEDTEAGLVIHPDITGLSAGEHGFHLHSIGNCEPGENSDGVSVAGLMAGGHWDPEATGTHRGPFENGHRGDLSRLVVNDDGTTTTDVVAPRLSTADLKGKALVIHAGGDTYTDTPPLGGGGHRVACGVVG